MTASIVTDRQGKALWLGLLAIGLVIFGGAGCSFVSRMVKPVSTAPATAVGLTITPVSTMQFSPTVTPSRIPTRSPVPRATQTATATASMAATAAVIATNTSQPPITLAPGEAGTEVAAVPVSAAASYVSGITSQSRQIFLSGQEMGNRANVFTTVGDSMTDSYYFLHPFGDGVYDLAAYGQLAPVLGYFMGGEVRGSNPFASRSVASFGGWTSQQVITPGERPDHVAAGVCLPEETPLVCEYRTAQPAVALIMLGTNDLHELSYDQFSANLVQIVETSIAMGVIPVLSTIPEQNSYTGAVASYNDAIRGIARRYDIPLWDYWAATHDLPDAGISDDGLHPSVPPGESYYTAVFTPENLLYGFTVRNLTALQVLDALWRQVLY